MVKQIMNKIKLATVIVPAYAQDSDLNIKVDKAALGTEYGNITGITPQLLLTGAIYAVFAIVAIIFLVLLISGGFKWLTSGGDEKKLAAARSSITSAFIGLVVVISAWAIIQLIGTIFGFSPFDFNIPALV